MAKKNNLSAYEKRQKFYDNFNIAKSVLSEVTSLHSSDMIISLDTAMGRTGMCSIMLNDNSYNCDSIKPSDKLSRYNKLHYLNTEIINKMRNKDVVFIVMEDYSFGSPKQNTSRMTSVAELGGLVRYAIGLSRIPVMLVAPVQLKKFILGSGHGDKNLILMNVLKRFGIECRNDDEADAVVLADIGKSLLTMLLTETLESNDDEYLKKYLKEIPECLQRHKPTIHKYQYEVLCKLIQEKGDTLTNLYVD